MSDHPGTSFALGYLAAGSATELAREGALSLTRALRPRAPSSTVDVNAVLQAAQEADEYVQKLERYVEDLQREVRELRAHSAKVESDRDKMYAWADWAEAELRRRTKAE